MADAVLKRAFAIKQNRSLQQTVSVQYCSASGLELPLNFLISRFFLAEQYFEE